MIWGDARSDLRGPRFVKKRPARGRKVKVNIARKTARVARQPPIERGRGGEDALGRPSMVVLVVVTTTRSLPPLVSYSLPQLKASLSTDTPTASPSTPAPGNTPGMGFAGNGLDPMQLQTPQPTPGDASHKTPTPDHVATARADTPFQLQTPGSVNGGSEAERAHLHGTFRGMGRSRSLDGRNKANCAHCATLEAQGQLRERRITDLEHLNADVLQENAALREETQVLRNSNETMARGLVIHTPAIIGLAGQ